MTTLPVENNKTVNDNHRSSPVVDYLKDFGQRLVDAANDLDIKGSIEYQLVDIPTRVNPFTALEVKYALDPHNPPEKDEDGGKFIISCGKRYYEVNPYRQPIFISNMIRIKNVKTGKECFVESDPETVLAVITF